MTRIKYTAFAALSGLVIASCGNAGSNPTLEKLISKRDSLKLELVTVNEQIAALDTANVTLIPLVTCANVRVGNFIHKVEVQGAIDTDENALINAEGSGIIEKIHVKEGDRVSAGQTLISINADIIASSIDELETALELANYLVEKQKKLMDAGLGVEVEYEQAVNNQKSLEKRLKTMKTQQGKTVVRAPFAGVIDEIMVSAGEMASPMGPLLRIVNNRNVSVTAALSENLLNKIKQGSAVDLIIPSLNDTTITSVIASRGNFIDPVNRTFKIRIDISNNQLLLPNQLANVSVTDFSRDSALVVPSGAILQDTQNNSYLYKLVDEKKDGSYAVKRITVRTLKQYKGEACIEIIEGKLNAGDRIVIDGAKGITAADRVKLI